MPHVAEAAAEESISGTLDTVLVVLMSLDSRFHGMLNEPAAEKGGAQPVSIGIHDMVERVLHLTERVVESFNRLEGKLGGPI